MEDMEKARLRRVIVELKGLTPSACLSYIDSELESLDDEDSMLELLDGCSSHFTRLRSALQKLRIRYVA